MHEPLFIYVISNVTFGQPEFVSGHFFIAELCVLVCESTRVLLINSDMLTLS